ncbi:MAG: hypothetical protein IJU84_03940 [Clostridia bacterium]|nr:hypothetical protein [Clostridia bacterium]
MAVSCSDNAAIEKKDDHLSETEQKTETTAVLYDFEAGLFNVRMPIYFGTITLNRNTEYVRSGEKSMKLCPGNGMADPYMYLPLESTLLGFSYTDIMKIYGYRLSIYSESVCEINLGLYFDKMANTRSPEQKFALNAGWNEIEYIPQYAVVELQYDVTMCKGIYIMFKTQETMPTIYVDDVKIILSDVSVSPEKLLILKRTETSFEVCDFENAYQHLMIKPTNYNSAGILPAVSVVRAADCGLTAPSGEKVLKVELFDHDTTSFSWTKVEFVPALIEEINFKQFVGHLDEYVLKFDTYRDFELVGSTYENLVEINAYYNGYGAMDWAGTTLTEQGVWQETAISLTSLENFINSQYSFQLGFMERRGNGSRVYYFDNFRIEKV